MKSGNRLLLIGALCVVVIWSETFISSKILLDRGLMPADIFFCRFLLAYLCVWPVSRKHLWAKSLADELKLFLLGFTGGALYFLAENTALEYSTASNVALILCCVPLVTAVLMSLVYKDERMNRRQITASLISLIGMVMIVLNGNFVLHLNPVGDLLAFGAVLVWGIYSLLVKTLSGKYDSVFLSRKVFAYGLISILPYFWLVSPLQIDLKLISETVVWANLVYLGVVASMFCYVIWNKALAKIGTVMTTNLLYCQPFFTMFFAHLVMGDRITWMAIAGAIILTIGMIRVEKG